VDLSKAISRKRGNIGSKLVLITNRKSYMSFRLVPKSVTLNDTERRNGRYFVLYNVKKLTSLKNCVRSEITRLKQQKSFCDLQHGGSL